MATAVCPDPHRSMGICDWILPLHRHLQLVPAAGCAPGMGSSHHCCLPGSLATRTVGAAEDGNPCSLCKPHGAIHQTPCSLCRPQRTIQLWMLSSTASWAKVASYPIRHGDVTSPCPRCSTPADQGSQQRPAYPTQRQKGSLMEVSP